MLFAQLTVLLERISNAAQKSDKIRCLEELWMYLRSAPPEREDQSKGAAPAAAEDKKPAPVVTPGPAAPEAAGKLYFQYMRLIMPQLDTLRSTYGLKESKIAKFYVELLGLPPTSADAIRFLHWKDPSKNSVETTSFSDVVFVVLGRRGYTSKAPPSDALTVAEMNSELDRLCHATTTDEKKAVLMRLLRKCSAVEHKWIIRIITKEMKMHLMHQSILAAFHPSAMELYNNTNDLAYVCKKCTEPSELLVAGDMKHGIFLFQPFKPMLASVVNSAKLSALLQMETIIVEPKFDGERMMIHYDAGTGKIQYWTRNAKNYTAMYGPKFDDVFREALGSGSRGQQLLSVSNVILDGEFLLWDSVTKEYKEFGGNRTFALSGGGGLGLSTKANDPMKVELNVDAPIMMPSQAGLLLDPSQSPHDSSHLWFCYQVFDVVFLNGQSLLQTSLEKRKHILKSILKPVATKFEIVPHHSVGTIGEILKFLDESLTANHEGIMIKVESSHYVPGERRQKWLKLKPDHVSGMADTLDLIILGGYYGTKYGLRHISHFLLGVWKNDSSATPVSPGAKYLTFCKVGTGYSEQELRELQSQLDAKWIPLPHGTVPQWLEGWRPGAGEVPDMYIDPKDSLVLEIFGYSFTSTTKFSVGQTLRFPRCHRVRNDKSVSDATDLVQLIQILQSSRTRFSEKLAAVATGGEGLVMVQAAKRARKQEDAKVKREQMTMTRTIAVVPASITVTQSSTVARVSSFLEGYEMCILSLASPSNSSSLPSRADLERLILSHGGAVVANPQPRTTLLVASSATAPKVAHWVQSCQRNTLEMSEKFHSIDVVHISWLLDCIEQQQVLPLAPRHMLYTSPAMASLFQHTLDEYDDSYYDPATIDTLRSSIQRFAAKAPHEDFTEQCAAGVRTLIQCSRQLARAQDTVLSIMATEDALIMGTPGPAASLGVGVVELLSRPVNCRVMLLPAAVLQTAIEIHCCAAGTSDGAGGASAFAHTKIQSINLAGAKTQQQSPIEQFLEAAVDDMNYEGQFDVMSSEDEGMRPLKRLRSDQPAVSVDKVVVRSLLSGGATSTDDVLLTSHQVQALQRILSRGEGSVAEGLPDATHALDERGRLVLLS